MIYITIFIIFDHKTIKKIQVSLLYIYYEWKGYSPGKTF
jgi:hypothetical protein